MVGMANAGEIGLVRSKVSYTDTIEPGGTLWLNWSTSTNNEYFAYTVTNIPVEFNVTEKSVNVVCNKSIETVVYPDQIGIRSKSAVTGIVLCNISIEIPRKCPIGNYSIGLSEMVGADIMLEPKMINLTVSMAPEIISCAPESPVSDLEGSTRTFNITLNQIVNVSWRISGTEVQINESVTEASYTNASAAVGIWNVSAIATNPNGTAMQTWMWNVTKTLPSNITATNITVTNITINSATIKWTTNFPSDSMVKYGTSPGNYTLFAYNPRYVTSHIINLIGLTPCTTYYYVVNSTDAGGNSSQSSEYSFTTYCIYGEINPVPPDITDDGNGYLNVTPPEVFLQALKVTDNNGIDLNNVSGSGKPLKNIAYNIKDSAGNIVKDWTSLNDNVTQINNVIVVAGSKEGYYDILLWTWNASSTPGNYTVTIKAEDDYNVTTVSTNFTVPVFALPPSIVSFSPIPPVNNIEGETRSFNITVNQTVNISWQINGITVQTNISVTEASYTNKSAAIGTWNISAIASNDNGTTMHTWIWNVMPQTRKVEIVGYTDGKNYLDLGKISPISGLNPYNTTNEVRIKNTGNIPTNFTIEFSDIIDSVHGKKNMTNNVKVFIGNETYECEKNTATVICRKLEVGEEVNVKVQFWMEPPLAGNLLGYFTVSAFKGKEEAS
jgi:hypothetical protein